jgi:hypothetical protein
MGSIISTIGLAFAGLFIGYAVALGVAVSIICYKQYRGKPVPVFLRKIAGSLVQ